MVVLIIRWGSVNLMSTKHENRDAYSHHKLWNKNKLPFFRTNKGKPANERVGEKKEMEKKREAKRGATNDW